MSTWDAACPVFLILVLVGDKQKEHFRVWALGFYWASATASNPSGLLIKDRNQWECHSLHLPAGVTAAGCPEPKTLSEQTDRNTMNRMISVSHVQAERCWQSAVLHKVYGSILLRWFSVNMHFSLHHGGSVIPHRLKVVGVSPDCITAMWSLHVFNPPLKTQENTEQQTVALLTLTARIGPPGDEHGYPLLLMDTCNHFQQRTLRLSASSVWSSIKFISLDLLRLSKASKHLTCVFVFTD